MSQRAAALARALDLSGPLLTRYLAGFTDHTRTTQATNLPNHVAWTLGHCAIAMHRLANRLTGEPAYPDADFVPGDALDPEHPGHATGRYSVPSVVYGSTPIDRPSLYPSLARGVQAFDNARARLVSIVARFSDHDLDRQVPWQTGAMTAADLVARLAFHNGVHAGQITDLRRALRMGPINL
jgi:hypothetical protein